MNIYLFNWITSYYSNNFVDFEKQLATDLFLRVYRPGAGPLIFPTVMAEDFASAAAATSVRAGQAFLLSSEPAFESYMHWLWAWATLPPYRPSFTAWLPRSAFENRQHALKSRGTWTTDSRGKVRARTSFNLVRLVESDPGLVTYIYIYRYHFCSWECRVCVHSLESS